ncbi:MAG TPA: LysM peptidoglycan-binding domain-containing protein [Aquaticitalea sp.]|nr:LysM peptidoglycan-binding domain-containing protein [Aquaticitalea sp.]
MKRLYPFCMLFFLCIYIGNAQQDTTTHTVVRGETILQIAKKYSVTPYDIQQANRDVLESLDDIKEHQVLVIPKSKISTPQLASAAEAIKASVAVQDYSYTVKKGETKYGLAKRFGIPIPQLEALNPHIRSGLNEGHVLKINTPINESHQPPEALDTNEPPVSFEGYKTHLVLKGETLWGISHANGLTVAQLVSENHDVLTGILREGQTLKIPQVRQNPSLYKRYLVVYGDTKYGLSKKYHSTIEELERLNPHIKKMLQAGHTLKIPSETLPTHPNDVADVEQPAEVPAQNETNDLVVSDANTSKIETEIESETINDTLPKTHNATATQSPATSDAYTLYEIKPKETLYGLSKKAGMSIADFVVLNPQLKEAVQIGTLIKMPTSGTITEDSVSKNPVSSNSTMGRQFKDLSQTMEPTLTKKMLFFLPFSPYDIKTELAQTNIPKNDTDEFKRTHLEFYSGAKIAIDSIKSLGYDLDLTVHEVSNTKRNSNFLSLVNNRTLLTGDAIIMPYYEAAAEEIATTVSEKEIPVITAATISHQTNLDNLFSALPSINQQRKKMLDYLLSKQKNIIVVSDVNRTESKDFIVEHLPNARFVTLKKNGTFNEEELVSNFEKDQMNYVILDSERNSVFLNVTNLLLSELNRYSIQLAVLDQNIIPDTDAVSVKRFRILKMLFPSLSSVEMRAKSVGFHTLYENTYQTEPSETAIIGFDITFDTLLRLFQNYTFETSAQTDITVHTTLTFDYELNTRGGYSNDGIYILQYDTNSNLQQAD